VTASARAKEYNLVVHGTQSRNGVLLATERERKCPTGHSSQTELVSAPATAEKVPARQRRELLARNAGVPSVQDVPGAHSVHPERAGSGAKAPAEHPSQVASAFAPRAVKNLLAWHSVHTTSAVFLVVDE